MRSLCGYLLMAVLGSGCADPAAPQDGATQDAAAQDAAAQDAATQDAATQDAAAQDAAAQDAATLDAAAQDAAAQDSAAQDAGDPGDATPDARERDVGVDAEPDGHDAGTRDAGAPDVGPPDTGPPDAGPPEARCGPDLSSWDTVGVAWAPIREVRVATPAELDAALRDARPGDAISLLAGTWSDLRIDVELRGRRDAPIALRAETPGTTRLQSAAIHVGGEHVFVQGFVFAAGAEAPLSLRSERTSVACDGCRVTENVFVDHAAAPPTTRAYVRVFGRDHRIDHNVFVGNHSEAPNIFVFSGNGPAHHHRIDHNYFGERAYVAPDVDGEMIALGSGPFGDPLRHPTGRSLIDHNYFCEANREEEIISVKSSENLLYANTFDTSRGGIFLRFGQDNVVDGNSFYGEGVAGTAAVGVMGPGHTIQNNVVERSGEPAIVLRSGTGRPSSLGYRSVQPVHDVTLAHNTYFGCAPCFQFGRTGDHFEGIPLDVHPRDITFINELASSPGRVLVREDGGADARFFNTIFHREGAALGFTPPAGADLRDVDPRLGRIGERMSPEPGSPAIDAGDGGARVDHAVGERCRDDRADIGASEHADGRAPPSPPVRFDDVGPSYDTSFLYTDRPRPSCRYHR